MEEEATKDVDKQEEPVDSGFRALQNISDSKQERTEKDAEKTEAEEQKGGDQT